MPDWSPPDDVRREWDAYARRNPLDDQHSMGTTLQQERTRVIADRVYGTVLDVGGGDGYIASKIRERGHWVKVVDISPLRVLRCWELYSLPAESGDATDLHFPDGSYDTVVVGEVLEHIDNPGQALAEACRVARKRVVVSLPLNGWADPTHRWRIRCDQLSDPTETDPTKGEQIVLTFERGPCWGDDYPDSDPTWAALFGAD